MNKITQATVIAGSTVVALARLRKADGTYMVESDVDSIRIDLIDTTEQSAQVYVDSTGETITDGSAYAAPSVASVVYNTLQTDSRWTGEVDSTGYNIAYKFAVPTRDHLYQLRITFTQDNGDSLVLVFELTAK